MGVGKVCFVLHLFFYASQYKSLILNTSKKVTNVGQTLNGLW